MIGGAVLAGACSNGPRKGFDTMGAGATPGVSGGRPGPASAAGSVAPTMTATDTSKHATVDTTAKKRDNAKKKP
jgi:hypothetical protein